MADFYQHGHIGTLHRLGVPSVEELEEKLLRSSKRRPIALLIPVTLEDSNQKTFSRILKVVSGVKYLSYIVVTTGQVTRLEDFAGICRKVRSLCPRAVVLWSSGPRVAEIIKHMAKLGLPVALAIIGGDPVRFGAFASLYRRTLAEWNFGYV